MEPEILKEMQERMVKSFMDIVVLAELRNCSCSMSGHDVIHLIHRKFNVLISSGTVYALLYSMEREGLIRGVWRERKRVYTLTEKGSENIETVFNTSHKILGLVKKLLMKEE